MNVFCIFRNQETSKWEVSYNGIFKVTVPDAWSLDDIRGYCLTKSMVAVRSGVDFVVINAPPEAHSTIKEPRLGLSKFLFGTV